MTAELIELTEELRATNRLMQQVTERLDEADRRARRHRLGSWVTAATVVAIGALGLVAWQDEQDDDYRACVQENETRANIREAVVGTVKTIVDRLDETDALAPLLAEIDADLLAALPPLEC